MSKRQRIFHSDIDIGELISSHEVCVPPGVNLCVVDSEATSSLNNVTDRSNCPSHSMDFLTRKSGNTYIDETTVSNQFLIQQVFLKLFCHLSYSNILLFFFIEIWEHSIQISSMCCSGTVKF